MTFDREILSTRKVDIMTAEQKLSCGHTVCVIGLGYRAKVGEVGWCPTCRREAGLKQS